MIERGEAEFARLFADEYYKSGLSPKSVEILVNYAVTLRNLRYISNEQILALPGFDPEDLPKLNSLRSK